ncbi:MAG: hypothetical protein ACTSYA_01850 [Candidatus Kariarchaeaceae archaeon]
MQFVVYVSHKINQTYTKVIDGLSEKEAKEKVSQIVKEADGVSLEDYGFEHGEDYQIEEPKVTHASSLR